MPKGSDPRLTFNGGVIDDQTLTRVDLEGYGRYAAEMTNIMPLVQGGMTKAPGTQYLGQTAGNEDGRLIPFVFNEDNAFMLEYTLGEVRIWSGTGLVVTENVATTFATTDWVDQSAATSTGGGTASGSGTGEIYDFTYDFDFSDLRIAGF